MTEHLSAQLILQYRTRALAPAELLALDRHLEGCERCRATLRVWLDVPAPQDLHAQVFAESVEEEKPEPASWWRNLVNFEGLFEMPLVWRVAGAMVVLGLLAWGVTRWRQVTVNREELATSSPTVTPSVDATATIAATPLLLLAIKDGNQSITLNAQGNLNGAEALTPAEQTALKAALTTGKIETSRALAGLQSKGNILMSGTGTPDKTKDAAKLWAARSPQTLLHPFGSIVAEARPTFRWKPLAEATHYQVIISDPAANYREVAASPKLTSTSWTPSTALPRDRLLIWQVIAALPNGQEVTAPAAEAAEAKFRLLSAAQQNELTSGQQRYAQQHLPLALLFARLGLIESAEHELRALAKDNPQSPIVEKMLRDLHKK